MNEDIRGTLAENDLVIRGASPSEIIQTSVQSDWTETDIDSGAYIKHKPATMPPSSHSHGDIQNNGTIAPNSVTPANGDRIIISDSSGSRKITQSSISFDGSTTNKALTPNGTWESFAKPADVVPPTRKVNGHALSSDVTVTASDIGVEDGAEVNVLEGVKVDGNDLPITNKKTEIPKAYRQYGVVRVDEVGTDGAHSQMQLTDGTHTWTVPTMTSNAGTGTIRPRLLPDALPAAKGAVTFATQPGHIATINSVDVPILDEEDKIYGSQLPQATHDIWGAVQIFEWTTGENAGKGMVKGGSKTLYFPVIDSETGKIDPAFVPGGGGGDYVLTYDPLSSVGSAEIGEAVTGTPNYTPAGEVVFTVANVEVLKSAELPTYIVNNELVFGKITTQTRTIKVPTAATFIGTGVTFVIQEEE